MAESVQASTRAKAVTNTASDGGEQEFTAALARTEKAAVPPGETATESTLPVISQRRTIPEERDVQAWNEINRRKDAGKTYNDIWFEAAQAGDREITGALIRKPPEGWNVNARDLIGQTALHHAILAPNGLDMVKILVDEGKIDIAIMDYGGSYSAYKIAEQYSKSSTEIKAIADFLKEKLDHEARTAFYTGKNDRLDALVAAGATRPEDVDEHLPSDGPSTGPGTAAIRDFPLLNDLDVLKMKTGEKDSSGNEYSVSSLTIKTLMEKYKKGIDDGTLKDTDARYKLYYAMQATGDTAFGRGITPYFENGPNGGRSERWEGNDYQASAADMQAMYKTEEVKKFFKENANDPGVLKDWKEAQDSAVSKIPNKEELKTKIKDMLLSDNFKTYLNTLKSEGKLDKAVEEAQRGITSYSTLATQQEVDDVVGQMGQKDLVDNLETILASPDKIEDQYWEAATADWAAMSLEAINRGIQLGRHGLNSIKLAETKAWFEKVRDGSIELRQTAAVFKAAAKSGKMPDTISQAQLDAIGERVGSAWGERTPLRSFFTNLNNAGAFSTGIGTIALAGAIYQQTHGSAFDDNHLQNMQIARGYLLFLGTTPEMAKLGSSLTKYPGIAKFLGSGDTSAIFGAKNIQDIFKVDARDPMTKLVAFLDDLAVDTSKAPAQVLNKLRDKMVNDPVVSSGLATKFAASAIKVMGATAFTGFGIVDAVLGGFTAKAGADQHDPAMLAQGIMQVVTGAFTTAAGIAMGLSAAGVAAAAPFISPLLLGAAIVGSVIIAIDIVKAIIAMFKEDDVKSMGDRAYFEQQSKFGLTQDDWSEKLEYLDLSGFGEKSNGKGVNSTRPWTPKDKSVFETYDWKDWLKEYNKKHDEVYNSKLAEVPSAPFLHGGDPTGQAQNFENNLNWICSYYYENISILGRTVPSMTGDLANHVKELAKYYFQYIDANASNEKAGNWIRDQIAGRLPGAYPDGEQHTQDDEKDDGVEAKVIFENWYNKTHPGQSTGKEDVTALVGGIMTELSA